MLGVFNAYIRRTPLEEVKQNRPSGKMYEGGFADLNKVRNVFRKK